MLALKKSLSSKIWEAQWKVCKNYYLELICLNGKRKIKLNSHESICLLNYEQEDLVLRLIHSMAPVLSTQISPWAPSLGCGQGTS